MKKWFAGIVSVMAMAAAPVLADEMWDTSMGRMIWETDIGETAVLLLNGPEGQVLRAFVPGLARDVAGGRGLYRGYWTASGGEEPCEAQLIDPMGSKTYYWGTFTMTFVADAFPSDWAGVSGSCFYPQETAISGVAAYE